MLVYKYYAVLLEVPRGYPLVSEMIFEYDDVEDVKKHEDFRPYALIWLLKA